jgi:hypothetical protein
MPYAYLVGYPHPSLFMSHTKLKMFYFTSEGTIRYTKLRQSVEAKPFFCEYLCCSVPVELFYIERGGGAVAAERRYEKRDIV